MLYVYHALPGDAVALGIVRAEGVSVDQAPPGFEARLAVLLAARRVPLSQAEEGVRRAARDLLRNGRYKPTGRGKPASEYLVRAAHQEGYRFPRINAPVDVANYVSLKTLLPISLWDLDRAGTRRFCFRLGRSGEAYVFNTAGQTVTLEDLVVGCGLAEGDDDGQPLVNPVKDSLVTKTTDRTRRVAACLYSPLSAVSSEVLEAHCAEFAGMLASCGDAVETARAVVMPGEKRQV